MPGIIEELMHRMRPAPVPEEWPANMPPMRMNAEQEAPPAVPAHEVPVDVAAPQMANPDNGIYFDTGLYNAARAQINWAGQAPAEAPWQGGRNLAYVQPWEIRQQIYPQAIETRLSAADVEKIAQRIITLWEERLAE